MANGYRQIYGDRTAYFFGIRGYQQWMDTSYCNYYHGSPSHWRIIFSWQQTKNGGLIMGTIVGSIFVITVAIVGVVYFTWQDKKEAKRAAEKKAKQA